MVDHPSSYFVAEEASDDPLAGVADDGVRPAAWSEALAPVFDRIGFTTSVRSQAGTVRHRRLGNLVVGEIASPGLTLGRSDGLVLRQGLDHLLVLICTAGGGCLTDPAVRFGPGTLVVLDLARSIDLALIDATLRTLILPRARVAALGSGLSGLHGRVVAPAGLEHLTQLLEGLDGLAASAGARPAALAQAVEGLAIACLPCASEAVDEPAMAAAALVRQHIEENLAAPDLGVETMAQRFGVSRATLYRLFAEEGGVAHYVRRRRLAVALRRLSDRAGRPRISQLAYGLGFEDEKSFSRAFKRAFGTTPRDFANRAETAPNYGRGAILMDWLQTLG